MESFTFLKPIYAFILGLLLTLLLSGIGRAQLAPNQISQVSANPAALVIEGSVRYERSQFPEAISVWQKAAQAYAAQGDVINQALALSNLSLTYQQLGQWTAAKLAIEDSLNKLSNQPNSEARSQVYAQALDIRGHLHYAQGHIQNALDDWQKAAIVYARIGDRSKLLINQLNQAQVLQRLGAYRQAREILTQLKQSLEQQPNLALRAKGLRSLGQAYAAMGNFQQSEENLKEGLKILQKPKAEEEIRSEEEIREENAIQLSLGNTAWANAKQVRGTQQCEQVNISQETDEAKTCKNFIENVENALVNYENAKKSSEIYTQIQAQLNELTVLLELKSRNELSILLKLKSREELRALIELGNLDTQNLWQQIRVALFKLSPSQIDRRTVYAEIKLAKLLTKLQLQDGYPSDQDIAEILSKALKQAQGLGDQRAESYALGNLGLLYQKQATEANEQWKYAQDVTETALSLAKAINASELTYQWQWQLGRILQKRHGEENRQAAIASYTAAVKSLESTRNDLLGINSDIQFTFRDDIEPVYRELLALLLPADKENVDEKVLEDAFYYVESLQLAELENFFQCSLTNFRTVESSSSDENKADLRTKLKKQISEFIEKETSSALIYPIILKDHLALILQLPKQPRLTYYPGEKVAEGTVRSEIANAITSLTSVQARALGEEEQEPLAKLYRMLIAPIRNDLENVKNLVFILDGELRKIPMAALYDREHQKYLLDTDFSSSVVPSIQLLRPSQNEKLPLKALLAGAIKQRDYYGPLEEVPHQINLIKKSLESPSILLKSDSTEKIKAFTKQTFREALQSASYNIIHLATHGKFSSNLQNTKLLTDDETQKPEDYSITLEELGDFLTISKQPRRNLIDLLVLSACDSAKGDNRAVLGMAGVAAKFGATATIAPLWTVDQKSSTLLMDEFYQQLRANPKASKTAVLKMAQNSFRDKYKHKQDYLAPYHWAPFILVGN